MRSILNFTKKRRRDTHLVFLTAILFGFSLGVNAQCEDHPEKKTAVRFSNESRFELTFFVDEDEQGVFVPPKSISREVSVEPGEHLLRARAVVRGEIFWVWSVNEVTQGQGCTWTIEDPPRQSRYFRSKARLI